MRSAILLAIGLMLVGCVAREQRKPVASELRSVDIGFTEEGYTAAIVAENLNNPSFVSFHPNTGALTVCDSANGRVLSISESGTRTIVRDMETEYWKILEDGRKLYKVGPLAAIWTSESELAVTNAGMKDGEETVLFLTISPDDSSQNKLDRQTNAIPPTTNDEADKGEGNLSGMCVMPDGNTFYVCGQGYDGKSWILKGKAKEANLKPWLSADDNGIEINSPMQVIPWRGNLLVVYSGTGGKDDGLVVEWDQDTRKPIKQWNLPGLIDPMGIAQVPGKDNQFVVTDNNWSLDGVNNGKLALVTISDESEEASVQDIATRVPGPVHCAFGPDERLYVACLGEMYDESKGLVIAIAGFSR